MEDRIDKLKGNLLKEEYRRYSLDTPQLARVLASSGSCSKLA
jgi:hypothetical protein